MCRFLGPYRLGWKNPYVVWKFQPLGLRCGVLAFVLLCSLQPQIFPSSSSSEPLSFLLWSEMRPEPLLCSDVSCGLNVKNTGSRPWRKRYSICDMIVWLSLHFFGSRYFMWLLPASWDDWTLSPGPQSTLTLVRLCQVCLLSALLSTRSDF